MIIFIRFRSKVTRLANQLRIHIASALKPYSICYQQYLVRSVSSNTDIKPVYHNLVKCLLGMLTSLSDLCTGKKLND